MVHAKYKRLFNSMSSCLFLRASTSLLMSQLLAGQRLYNKRPARTRIHTCSVRTPVGGLYERKSARQAPRGTNEKQARKGLVFPFQPDPSFNCCKKKNCSQYFTDATDLRVKAAREPLYNPSLERTQLRKELWHNWGTHLLLPSGERCCKRMMLKIYACSSSMIYGDNRPRIPDGCRSQGEANSNRTQLASSIASWFFTLKETADCMPDEGWYQINTPQRCMVFDNYNIDAAENGAYRHCKSRSYFNQVWHENFPEIRLRKHCRFAKCDFCVHWRKKCEDTNTNAEARERLRQHRAWATVRERGLWHKKVTEATTTPDRAISISIDGMSFLFFSFVLLFLFPLLSLFPLLISSSYSFNFFFFGTQSQARISSHTASHTSGRVRNKTVHMVSV